MQSLQACTNLSNPLWSPVRTFTILNGSYYFSDPLWLYYPSRFYRLAGRTYGGRPLAPW